MQIFPFIFPFCTVSFNRIHRNIWHVCRITTITAWDAEDISTMAFILLRTMGLYSHASPSSSSCIFVFQQASPLLCYSDRNLKEKAALDSILPFLIKSKRDWLATKQRLCDWWSRWEGSKVIHLPSDVISFSSSKHISLDRKHNLHIPAYSGIVIVSYLSILVLYLYCTILYTIPILNTILDYTLYSILYYTIVYYTILNPAKLPHSLGSPKLCTYVATLSHKTAYAYPCEASHFMPMLITPLFKITNHDQVSSVSQQVQGSEDWKEKKTIRQHLTWLSPVLRLKQMFYFPICSYTSLITYRRIRSVLKNKQGDNQNPGNTFLGANPDDQDKCASAEPALSFALTQM